MEFDVGGTSSACGGFKTRSENVYPRAVQVGCIPFFK